MFFLAYIYNSGNNKKIIVSMTDKKVSPIVLINSEKIEESKSWNIQEIEKNPGIDENAFSSKFVTENEVKKDVIDTISFNNKKWSKKNIDDLTHILQFGNNHEYFKIDYKIVLSILSHESKMNIYETSKKNFDGSYDYGIGQQNSYFYKKRFIKACIIKEKYNIVKTNCTTDNFDIIAGAIATLLYLKENRDQLDNYGKTTGKHITFEKWIISYNSGLSGIIASIRSRNDNYKISYLRKVSEEYKLINNNGKIF
jgi:hypothetical protein